MQPINPLKEGLIETNVKKFVELCNENLKFVDILTK